MNPCFLIMPASERSNQVRAAYLDPACAAAEYEPVESERDLSRKIFSNLFTSLSSAPMALAYLGEPANWNPNVMIEVGYRWGSRRPVILLCDDTPADLKLPFDLADDRVVRLPAPDASPERRATVVTTIADMMKEAARDFPPLSSPLAAAILQVPTARLARKDRWVYIHASALAEDIFGVPERLTGASLEKFYEARKLDTVELQYRMFMREQHLLLASLNDGGSETDQPPVARVPLIFRSGRFQGRAYLPVVTMFSQPDGLLEFVVVYLDVTGAVKPIEEAGTGDTYYVCDTNPTCPPLDVTPPPPDDVGVFLAHSSHDKILVRQVYDALQAKGLKAWLDECDLRSTAEWSRQIPDAIARCKAAMIFLSAQTDDSFAAFEYDMLLAQHTQRRIPLVHVQVDHGPVPSQAMRFQGSFTKTSFQQVMQDAWLSQFVREVTGS